MDGRNHPYQFFLGREFLVAPVYRSQTASGGWRRNIHLPEGRWIDYWSGNVVEAGPEGRNLDLPVDLATLPILVRAGAIIPMYPESLYDGQVAADPLTLDLYPQGQSEFVLYEDDGNTRAYRDGAYSLQRFAMDDAGVRMTVDIAPAEGEFEGMLVERGLVFAVHTRRCPELVELDGAELPNGMKIKNVHII